MRKRPEPLELDIREVIPLNFDQGRIAQLGERRPYKPEVAGSIPVPPTIVLPKAKRVMSFEFVVRS